MNDKQPDPSVLRPVPMALFPTYNNLQEVVEVVMAAKNPSSNMMYAFLMAYHNTLLKVLKEHQPTT